MIFYFGYFSYDFAMDIAHWKIHIEINHVEFPVSLIVERYNGKFTRMMRGSI